MNFTEQEATILLALQRGLPLTTHPFHTLAQRLETDVETILTLARRLFAEGQARRFGAVFDSRRMGFRSALCAMCVDPNQLEATAHMIAAHPGITHSYERGWPQELPLDSPGGPGTPHRWPNLWFTLSTHSTVFEEELKQLQDACNPYTIYEMPATKRFKIDVVFDLRTRERDERVEPRTNVEQEQLPIPQFTALQRDIIRLMQDNLELTEHPFRDIAARLKVSEDHILQQLQAWQASGILRRLGILLKHRLVGLNANGMCCWDVPEAEITAFGRRIAAFPEVTHCYARPWLDIFPFRLYAMIHTAAWTQTQDLFERISREVGLTDGQLLLSLREFKKTSMQFF